jgi:hypothetical protein
LEKWREEARRTGRAGRRTLDDPTDDDDDGRLDRTEAPLTPAENDKGVLVDLYIPRHCSATSEWC